MIDIHIDPLADRFGIDRASAGALAHSILEILDKNLVLTDAVRLHVTLIVESTARRQGKIMPVVGLGTDQQ